MIALALLLAAHVATSPALAENDAAAPEVVTRIYDLAGLLPDPREELQLEPLMPFRLDYDWSHGGDEEVWEEDQSPGEMVEMLLLDLIASEDFALDDRAVWSLEDDRLLVTASPESHARLDALLAALRAAFDRRAELVIEVFAADGPLPPALAPDAVDALVKQGSLSLVERRREELVVGRTIARRSLRTLEVVREWETEIAQTSTAAQPLIDEWRLGSVWLLRLEDDLRGGLRLRWLQKLTHLVDEDSVIAGGRASIVTDQNLASLTTLGRFDRPRVGVAVTGGTRRLAVGEPLVAVARVETDAGPVGYVARLRLASVQPEPPPLTYGDGERSGELAVLDTSAVFWRRLRIEPLDGRDLWSHPAWGQAIEPVRFPADDWSEEGEALEQARQTLVDAEPRAMNWNVRNWTLLGGPASLRARFVETLATFAPRAEPTTVELRVERRVRRESGVDVIARAALSFDATADAFAVAGLCGLGTRGWDVDVANGAATGDPFTMGWFDGVSVRARGVDADTVDVDLCLHRLLDNRRAELDSDSVGAIDRLSFQDERLRRRLSVDGSERRWTASLGGPGGDETFEIVLSAARR